MDIDIKRINELANKNKTIGLTAEEKKEQEILRQEYIKNYRNNMILQLNNTYIIDADGNKTKLKRK